MSFGGLILTNQGRNEIASAISNERALDFTHVQLGDGIYEGSYLSKTELTNKVMEIPVSRVMRKDNEVTIDCDWNCDQAPRGFYFREIGIIGNHALCYYDNAGAGDAEYVDPESVTVSKEKRLRFTVVVSDDTEVTIHTASSLYALSSELSELDGRKVNESDIYEWARQPQKPSYNKSEIGLGNIDNTSDEEKPLSAAMRKEIQILESEIGSKAEQSLLDTHINNNTIHFTESERTKLSGIAAGANKYTHPASAAGAKASGLYKITTDAAGHVTGAAAVTKADITKLGIPGQDTNTTYGTGTASVAGLTKLYTSVGTGTDGTMTQKAITDALQPPIFARAMNTELVSTVDANGVSYPSNAGYVNIGITAVDALNSSYINYTNSIYRIKKSGYYYIKGLLFFGKITGSYDTVKRFFVNIINSGTTTMKSRSIEIIARLPEYEVASQSDITYIKSGEGLEALVHMDGGASGTYRAYMRIMPLFVS